MPFVDLSDRKNDRGFYSLQSDNRAIGKMAAEYFIARGFAHFGFSGFEHEMWSIGRREGFVDELSVHGLEAEIFESQMLNFEADDPVRFLPLLLKWLQALPKPAGSNQRGQVSLLSIQWQLNQRSQVSLLSIQWQSSIK